MFINRCSPPRPEPLQIAKYIKAIEIQSKYVQLASCPANYTYTCLKIPSSYFSQTQIISRNTI